MRTAIIFTTLLNLATSTPAFCGTTATTTGRDECLLNSKRCVAQVDDIQQRMRRLHKEIKKGTPVYSRKELDNLHYKLQEVQQMLDDLEKQGH